MERSYYRRDEEGIREVREKVASRCEEGMGYEEMWGVLEDVQDQVLKRKVRKRDRGRRGVKEVEWVTDEIREGVKENQRLNRLRRNSR